MKNDLNIRKMTSTSANSAEISEIILRETATTQLVFKPTLVNNIKNKKASVRGIFFFKKKRKNDEWESYKKLNLSQLKAEEWIKLEIKSEELLNLYQELKKFYTLYEESGIPIGENYIISDIDSFSTIIPFIKEMSKKGELLTIINKIKSFDIEDIKDLCMVAGIANFKKLLEIWELNKNNNNEEFWQKLFRNNYWCISQLFYTPVIYFREKAYIGGKSIDNTGGKLVDFLYQNKITKNVSLIEIKTPETKLLGRIYRDGVYSISHELSGSINQMLSYKDKIQKDYYKLLEESKSKFKLISPKCILICGNITDSLENDSQRSSFETFRKNLKDIEVVTYDELFDKIELFLNLLYGKDNNLEKDDWME